MSAALISADWGTTSLRAYLVDAAGRILDQHAAPFGIMNTEGRTFDDILAETIFAWLGRFPSEIHPVPVILSGMIGSRQGWHEADYLACPASPSDLANALAAVITDHAALDRCAIRIVPGMACTTTSGIPDVMRGEETQVLGALLSAGLDAATFVLPGTHSKWVTVRDGTIMTFKTFMTGEVFATLLDNTILGKLAEGDQFDATAFTKGVQTAVQSSAGPGDLLHLVFSARSAVLAGDLQPAAVHAYLSGLLIGAEITAANTTEKTQAIHLLAARPLAENYALAARSCGLSATPLPSDSIVLAHKTIAAAAGLLH